MADEDYWAVGALFQLQRPRLEDISKEYRRIRIAELTLRLAARLEASVSAWLTTESRDTPSVKAVTFAL
jgi:hypothetical protein